MSQEQRNMERIERWAHLYNTEVTRMINECYTEDTVVDCPNALLVRGRRAFTALEEAVLAAAPWRWCRIDRTVAEGNVVAVLATLFDPDQGDEFQTRFCSVLTFNEDGLVTNDTAFIDATRWPMPSDVAERLAGLDVEWKVPVEA